jgi:hypothetical protein
MTSEQARRRDNKTEYIGPVSRLADKSRITPENAFSISMNAGNTQYRDIQIEDGDEAFFYVIDLFTNNQVRLKGFVEETAPDEVKDLGVSIEGYLTGLRNAAIDIGHQKNADYVSKSIERLKSVVLAG